MNDVSLELETARYDDPDVVSLTALAQGYYRSIYGGEDTNPISPVEFAPPHGGFLIGRLAGSPVAMGGWRRWVEDSPLPDSRAAEIRRMFVRSEFRGRGFAGVLLGELERQAAADGADLMILETGRPQTEALAFYAAHGYRAVAAFGHWKDSAGAVHLGKQLAASGR